MKDILLAFFCCILINASYCQKQHKISAYIEGEFINTLYDKTSGNNPWGIGLGFQTFLNNKGLIHPTIEISAATFLEDDKVLRLNPNGSGMDRINNMIDFFVGATIRPSEIINISLVSGPTLINSHFYFALKPSFGFYLSKEKKMIGKISYTNVFSRSKNPEADFGSLSFSVGISLFNK